MTPIADVFLEIMVRKACLDECLKGRLSEDPSTHNIANESKHCCNLNESTFSIFINHCEGNCGRKNFF